MEVKSKTTMAAHKLYLESGPRCMKTMVHAQRLLGCVANEPTKDAALGKPPGAFREHPLEIKKEYPDLNYCKSG